MSSSKSPTEKGLLVKAQRLPAPSLFVGPPSRNASNTSLLLSPQTSKDTRVPLSRQTSLLSDRRGQSRQPISGTSGGLISPTDNAAFKRPQSPAELQSNERTDALWAEMQNTLEEVELNAASGTHVFGSGHSKALDELRTAQIALAQAWARSEAEEEKVTNNTTPHDPSNADDNEGTKAQPLHTADILASDRTAKTGTSGTVGSATGTATKSQLEQETENDILLARKRREANDRYFERVNRGVLDVVAKLEDVAKAMKSVETESREIWGDKDGVDSGSIG
jgi:Disordered region of unknown function (DUF5315)